MKIICRICTIFSADPRNNFSIKFNIFISKYEYLQRRKGRFQTNIFLKILTFMLIISQRIKTIKYFSYRV